MATYKQDMPPKGGYNPLNFARVPAKSYFSGIAMFAGFAAFNTFTLWYYWQTHKIMKREEIEMVGGRIAITPMLQAEQDRLYLKQLRKNREAEAKIMANVEGWEVGTLYGEPVYKTIPEDQLVPPKMNEYYVFGKEKDLREKKHFNLYH